ncbi:MAG: hypothetical protein IT495_15865, partial [Gammaproteobacteria bacterium]|nr:hypothetical protein [Gammaproteobacteria bacterium]
MNGAEALLRTLAAGGVDLMLTNPGTSEMYLVEALEQVTAIRPVLTLCETVCSGAADGYARMSGRPAATLFHLGPGLANALANLHNARRAQVPIVNLVGDHATWHVANDPPLASDIHGYARQSSGWIHTTRTPGEIARDGAAAIVAARMPPGQIATLALPADCTWSQVDGPATVPAPPPRACAGQDAIDDCAAALR